MAATKNIVPSATCSRSLALAAISLLVHLSTAATAADSLGHVRSRSRSPGVLLRQEKAIAPSQPNPAGEQGVASLKQTQQELTEIGPPGPPGEPGEPGEDGDLGTYGTYTTIPMVAVGTIFNLGFSVGSVMWLKQKWEERLAGGGPVNEAKKVAEKAAAKAKGKAKGKAKAKAKAKWGGKAQW